MNVHILTLYPIISLDDGAFFFPRKILKCFTRFGYCKENVSVILFDNNYQKKNPKETNKIWIGIIFIFLY